MNLHPFVVGLSYRTLLLSLAITASLRAASDVTISSGATAGGAFSGDDPKVFTPTDVSAVANQTTIQTSLNAAAAVTLNTTSGAAGNGDLTVCAALTKSEGGTATLTLNAVRDLLVNSALSASTGTMPLVLTAGRTMASSASIASNGGNITIHTVQPFVLGSSLNAGAGQILLQTGSLESNASQTVTAGSVEVSAGAAWKQLGTVNGNLSVAGTLSAGPAAGSLQVYGALTLQADASTVVDLAGTGQGSTYDSITASGAVTLAGALQLNFLSGFENVIVTNNTFTLISGASLTGTFAGLPNNSRISIPNDQGSVKITYSDTAVTLSDWQPVINELIWDPGTVDDGTEVFSNTNTRAGRHYFHINAQATDVAAWKTRLIVASGEANIYLRYDSIPQSTSDYNYKSERIGSDGLVLRDDQYAASQEWYIMVNATAGAQWSLFTGRAWVQDLGPLTATEGANSGDVIVGPEGIVFFKTAVPANTPAWALWTRTNTGTGAPYTNAAVGLGVRQLKVPVGTTTDRASSNGQFLVVPPYLSANGDTYFVSLTAAPTTRLNLASYQQPVGTLPFETAAFAVALPADTFFYNTYRVDVPVQQIAWDLTATSTSGNLQICARRANVPNPGNNDAFVEAPVGVADGLTLVPPTLSDGVWYVTVYTDGNAAAGTLRSGPPVVTDINFVDQITNDLTGKSGWRIYRVTDIDSQLGCLGWDILLSAPVDNRLIAIRANAVPGRQQYRTNDNTGISSDDRFDYASAIGDLQRPAHQADVWYIGVYRPDAVLGAFTLTTRLLTAETTTFDAATPPGINVVTNQPTGLFQYFRIDVPAGVLGWDLRLTNVTSGSPRLVVRRDQLPASLQTTGFLPRGATAWPSGNQWAAGDDLTGCRYETDGSDAYGRVLHMGTGLPLEPGTYYVGVTNANGTTNAMSYTLQSRGIGAGQSIPVAELDFAGGSASLSGLAPREPAYYKVTVPAGQTSWQVKLSATTGEVALAVRKDALPNILADSSVSCFPYYGIYPSSVLGSSPGILLTKAGDEHYALLPSYTVSNGQTATTIPAGDYYLAVVSQGVTNVGATGGGLNGPRIGTGAAGYSLLSCGNARITALGELTVGGADLMQADGLEGGEVRFYTFTVPTGLASVQVSLENRSGNPSLNLPLVPAQLGINYGNGYGLDCMSHDPPVTGLLNGAGFVTLANPASGTYTVGVKAAISDSSYPDASYTLRVQGFGTVPVAFDGGTSAVVEQVASTWRYFRIDVPAGVLGWDLRLTNVTSGSPRLVVRRDLLPATLDTPYVAWVDQLSPRGSSGWPGGNQWAAGDDLTGCRYEADGSDAYGRVLHMGTGLPLEPGTYYVGVSNDSGTTTAMSYTLQSRGIGAGQSLPVTELDFAGGSASLSGLAPRELAYYKVTVPAGQMSWQVKLSATTGEVALAVRKDALPNILADSSVTYYPYYGIYPSSAMANRPGILLTKAGNEHYVLLPSYQVSNGQTATTIPAGDYYLAVVSQGAINVGATGGGLSGPRIGTGTADCSLLSRGNAQTSAMGNVTAGGADLTQAASLEGGEIRFYTFTVPAGLASVQVSLENGSGNPSLNLPLVPAQLGINYGYGYGLDCNGYGTAVLSGAGFVTLANPAAGTYTVGVKATISASSYPDASYTLRVQGLGTVPVAFDGGTSAVVDQVASTWRYFRIDVPAGVLGWDLRLTNVTSGSPRLVVRRDLLPATLDTPYVAWVDQLSPRGSSGWPGGNQWAAGDDLTGCRYEADGSDAYGRVLHMGTGLPLEPGTYYVGVTNANGTTNAMSYTLESRGIGAGQSIPVAELDFAGGSASLSGLAPRELAYYKVTVPTGQMSWQVKLSATTGEVALAARKDALPNILAWSSVPSYYGTYPSSTYTASGGILLTKAGNEHYVLLPNYEVSNGQTATTIPAGDYYLAVVSQGAINVGATGSNLNGPRIGTGTAGYTLASFGNAQPSALGDMTAGGADLTQAASLQGGEIRFYSFTVPTGLASVQVSLENRTGNPWLSLPLVPAQLGIHGGNGYGLDCNGDGTTVLDGASFVTLTNPAAGTYTVGVKAAISDSSYPDATYTLRVHPLSPVTLNFSWSQNAGNGGTHFDTRSVGDGQIAFYRVDVPATLDGQAILGWRVGLALTTGHADWRISKTYPPSVDYGNSVSASDIRTLNLTPPYLTPGTWYIQVQGRGLATYTLTSEPVVLRRPAWTMPAPGEVVVTPGLPAAGSVFVDTGLREDGTPLPDPVLGTVTDQGIDLANADYHYYAITVPENNPGLLHAELIAINGNPDLYVRQGYVPSSDRPETAATLKLDGTGTEYAAWVPVNTRTQTRLTAGTWYLAVQAGGTTNARYRLRLAHGNPLAGGLVQDLPLTGGSLTGQLLAAGDLRFYRVAVPADAPASWQITYSQTQGDVDLFVRDSAPPGISGSSYSPTSYYNHVSDSRSDNKNQGSYNYYANQGTTALTTPPLRPGNIYYLGFYANTDANFNVSSATTGTVEQPAALAFYGGSVSDLTVPAGGNITYRIEVPADATRWKHIATHAASVLLFIEEGVPVDLTRLATVSPHAQSWGAANWTFNQSLVSTNSWPWLPGISTFYLTIENTAASDQTISFLMNGKNALTEDEDGDGMPDAWERQYFGNTSASPGNDADSDGSTNLQEYQNGTDPMSAVSVKFQLVLAGVGASVAADPAPGPYLPDTNVTLSASPDSGLTFLGWAPSAYNASTGYAAALATNPLPVTMDGNKRYTAYAGVPLADALDGGGLEWTMGGTALWFGQTTTTQDGVDATQATGLQNYNDEAWVQTTVTAPGTIAWRWKLSEVLNGNSRIECYLDSSNIATLHNTTDWTQQTYAVTGTGQRTLRWRMVRETGEAAASGDAAFLDTVSFVPWVAPAMQPASNITYTAFTANWSEVIGASGYYLDVATSADFTSGFVINNSNVGNVVSFNVSWLQAGTDYYYRVRVIGAPGTSASSAAVTATTTPFPAPVAQAASVVGLNGFTANWSTVATATSYRLDVSSASDFSGSLLVNNISLGTTSYAVTGLQPGTPYYYRVRAVGAATSGNSNVINVTTLAFGPPVAKNARDVTSSGFTAKWAALAGATSYTLEVAAVADFSGGVATFAAISATSYNITGCLAATTYYYRVSATGAPGTSGNSNVVTVVTAAVGAPTITTQPLSGFITGGQSDTLTVMAGGADLTYQWYLGASGDTSHLIAGATAVSFTTPALTQTTSYWVRVSNGLGNIDSTTATLEIMPPSLTLAAWGDNTSWQTNVPAGTTGLVQVAGGDSHTLALKLDGTVLAWGNSANGRTSVPAGLTGVTDVAAGASHSLALKSDGTVVAWGYNGNGQTTIPTGLDGVTAIAAGPSGNHTLALKTDGTVVAWGYNSSGQTTVPAGLADVMVIAAGANHSLALKADGTVLCWGYGGYGLTTIPTGLSDVVSIAAGTYHNMALKADGTVVVWGYTGYGLTTVPAGLTGVVAIAAGAYHCLALKSDGTVVAWGDSTSDKTTVPAGLTGVVGIAAGANHSLALFEGLNPVLKLAGCGANNYELALSASGAWTVNETLEWVSVTPSSGSGNGVVNVSVAANNSARPRSGMIGGAGRTAVVYQAGAPANNGTLAAWGDNTSWQTSVPAGTTGLVKMAGGESHTLALKLDGTVLAWGNSANGRTSVPAGLTGVTDVAAGASHSLALKSDGTVVAWGYNGNGQTTIPTGLDGVAAIAAGPSGNHSLALKTDGTVVAWGNNSSGQTTVPTGLADIRAIAAGANHSLALKSDGTVLGWGYNGYGLATGPTGLNGVVAIAAGTYHNMALKADGTVVSWGNNGYGVTTVPAGLTGVVAIAAGAYHCLALKADGTVVAWGDSTSDKTTVPSGLTGVVGIAAGANHSLALKNEPLAAPAITGHPLGVTVNVPSNATFSVTATGTEPLFYQWQVSTDNGFQWGDLGNAGAYGGVNLPTLTVSTSAGLNGYQYRCVVSNNLGTAIGDAATLTDSESSAMNDWRQQYFGSPFNTGNGADSATPDHDGIPNLIKYGLVIMPGASGVHSLPPAQTRTYADGKRLVLIFTRDPARNDITLQVQGANSPAGPWTTLAISVNGAAFTGTGFVGETNASGGCKTVEIRDTVNITAVPRRFMRVEVTH